MRVYACLHVVVGAGAAGPAVEVPLPRRRDEEVVLARVEFQPLRCRTKRPETPTNLNNIDDTVIRKKPIEEITIRYSII